MLRSLHFFKHASTRRSTATFINSDAKCIHQVLTWAESPFVVPQLSELLEFPELERGDSGFLADKMHQLPLEMPVFNLCRNNNECLEWPVSWGTIVLRSRAFQNCKNGTWSGLPSSSSSQPNKPCFLFRIWLGASDLLYKNNSHNKREIVQCLRTIFVKLTPVKSKPPSRQNTRIVLREHRLINLNLNKILDSPLC